MKATKYYFTEDHFLTYHPNIVAKGEIWYFTENNQFKKGINNLLSRMPNARWVIGNQWKH